MKLLTKKKPFLVNQIFCEKQNVHYILINHTLVMKYFVYVILLLLHISMVYFDYCDRGKPKKLAKLCVYEIYFSLNTDIVDILMFVTARD